MTNVSAITGTMYSKVHEWLRIDGEWLRFGVGDFGAKISDLKLNAIKEIESFFSDRPKEFTKYQSDLRTKRAVERNIEIIGEALNRILKRDQTIVITNSRKMSMQETESSMATTLFQTM